MDARYAFMELYSSDNDEFIASTPDKLLKYCHQDTLAMVKVFEVLKNV